MGFTSGQSGAVSRAGDIIYGNLVYRDSGGNTVTFGTDAYSGNPALIFLTDAIVSAGGGNARLSSDYSDSKYTRINVMNNAGDNIGLLTFSLVEVATVKKAELLQFYQNGEICFGTGVIAADASLVSLYVDSLTGLLSFKDASGVVHTLA